MGGWGGDWRNITQRRGLLVKKKGRGDSVFEYNGKTGEKCDEGCGDKA